MEKICIFRKKAVSLQTISNKNEKDVVMHTKKIIKRLLHLSWVVIIFGSCMSRLLEEYVWVTYAGYTLLVVSMVLFFLSPHTHFRATYRALKEDLKPAYEKYRVKPKQTMVLLLLLLAAPTHAVYYGQASRQVNHYWRLSEKQYKDVNATNDLPTTVASTMADAFGDLYVEYNERVCPLSCVAEDFCLKLYGHRSYRGLSATQVLMGHMLYTPEWAVIKQKVVPVPQFRLFPKGMPDSLFLPQIMAAIDGGNNAEAYNQITGLRTYQQQCPDAEQLPSDEQFRAEQYYCRLNQTLPLACVTLLVGLVFFVWFGILFARANRRRTPGWMTATVTTVDVLLWLILSLLIGLRGWIGEYIPLTNAYEYLHGVAWISLTLSLVMSMAVRRGSMRGLLTAGLTLVAGVVWFVCGWLMPHQMVMPGHCSLLTMVHSLLLMPAYTMLAILVLLNLYSLMASLVDTTAHHTALTIYHLSHLILTPAVFLLALATCRGTIWTIVAMLVYAAPIHWHPTHQRVVSLRQLRCFNAYLVLAFLVVLIPYLRYVFC